MKDFFKTIMASTIGVVIGSTILGFFGLIIIVAAVVGSGKETYTLKDETILKIELSGELNDRISSSPFNALLGKDDAQKIDDVVDAIKKAKENKEVKAIYLRASDLSTGIANLEPIRKALIDFKESGKYIFAYADSYSQGTYYLASVANKIALNPKGSVDFHGLASITAFPRGMYEKMGVKFQVYKVGTFKSAVEPLIQDKMSDANREQVTAFLGDTWSHLLAGISEARSISVEKLNEYADECLAFTEAETLLDYKIVDTLMYSTEQEAFLKKVIEVKEDAKLKLASVDNLKSVPFKEKGDDDNRIAVLYAQGSIYSVAEGGGSSPFASGTDITDKEYVKELQKLKDDKKVKAVVFRVNSGGGSAYASEQIWNAVVELKKEKPVIVSMGNYAASGGYYISCAADCIVAEPTTLTGSIGIFGLIPDGTELAKKMGLTFDEVKTNKHGALGGVSFGIPFLVQAQSRGMTDEESRLIQKHIEQGYDLFITRCADGRSMTKEQIDEIGQGRVWTGNQALANGLVDKLGGLEDAIAIAAERAKLENYSVASYPTDKNLMAKMLEKSMGNAKVSIYKSLMGDKAYNQELYNNTLKATDFQMAIMSESIIY